jgi:L-alanine-DL-glutamate epimerase-like enolase superfamily enzyme
VNASSLTIAEVAARAVVAPLKRPVRTAVGTIPAAPLVLIDLRTREGVVGRAYLFGYTPLALAPLVRLVESLGEELKGQPAVPAERQAALDRRFRLLGWQGLVGMAVAGVDMALWDALGHAAGWPVARLLGGEPKPLAAYDSYGVVDRQLTRPTSAARSSGVSGRSRSKSATPISARTSRPSERFARSSARMSASWSTITKASTRPRRAGASRA